MYIRGKISEKDCRMCFKLNNITRITILNPVGEKVIFTPVGEKETYNGISQGSFAAALPRKITSNIGTMPLNCLILQDNMAKMNMTSPWNKHVREPFERCWISSNCVQTLGNPSLW